ncbi:MAG TPA: SDR family oxidoreductase [Steroidobacteraceae bacterium]
MDISNKTVVVTGAGRGIGRAIALKLARHGADIALFDLNADDLAETSALCAAQSVQARGYRVNVADEGEVSAAMTRVAADFGRLDGLVNNAGIVRDGLLVKVKDGEVVGRMTMDQWNAVIGVNLSGVFLCAREAAAHMIELGNGGVIVNISSISRAGNAGQSNYSAAKAGVESMGVVWAKELARYGIRVGSIAPGFTHTEILSSMRPEVLDKLTAPVPLKRLGQPDEIAHAVLFIFENDFFTGRCLEVDGGLRL